jgi:DNA polymerase I-like protein with 3'-5' exonuclease and polymerase domains
MIAKRVQCRHRRSNLEGWKKLIRPDGRIAARVSGVATTGRMKHAGIVNVPGGDAFFGKQMRKVFIAKPGYTLVGCDSAGCQNRMLAARVGDDFFTDTLINGSKEDGTSIHHVNQRAIKEVAGLEVSYHMAKTLNYAMTFGASDKKLASSFGSTDLNVGAKIREALLSVAAGFEALVTNLTKEWRSNAKQRINDWGKLEYHRGCIAGLDGRPIVIDSEHQILVYMLQSDEGIMMSAAYNLLCKRLSKKYKHGVDYGVVAFVHDEFTVECREEIAKDVASIAERCIVDAGKFYNIACPHEGEAKIGKTWWDIH